MLTLTSTKKEQDEVVKRYHLNLLRKIKNQQTEKDIVSKKTEEFDIGTLYDKKPKSNVFGTYVDFIVVKNHIIEQLKDRLKTNKESVVSFVSKLNMDELFIVSQRLQDFIKFILDTNKGTVNDYILKSNFTTFKIAHDKEEQQKSNEQIVRVAKQEEEETLRDVGVSTTEGRQAEEEDELTLQTDKGYLYDDVSELTDELTVLNDGKEVTYGTLFDLLDKIDQENKTYKAKFYEGIYNKLKPIYPFLSPPPITKTTKGTEKLKGKDAVNQIYNDVSFHIANKNDKEKDLFVKKFMINYRLSQRPQRPQNIREVAENVTKYFKKSGKGIAKEYIQLGRYFIQPQRLATDKVLQVRSGSGTQVIGMKSVRLTNKTKRIIDKVLKSAPITYEDVNVLNDEEKDQLYMVANKMKIAELMNLPSQMKNKEEKLRDEYELLRGEIVNGNDAVDVIKKFKLVILKLRNAKLITSHEYNDVLKLLFELEL